MKRFSIYLFVCLMIIMAITGCSNEKNIANPSMVMISKEVAASSTLSAIEVPKNNKFTPTDGIAPVSAQDTIIKYLEKNGIKGDIRSSIKLKEITIKEAWENVGVQLYHVEVDYAWLYGVAIVKGGKVLCILDGMPTHKVFIADVDSDGYYEVYTNVYFGSGIVSSDIRGYNIATDKKYSLSKRTERDLLLIVQDNTLLVKEYPYNSPAGMTGDPIEISSLQIKDGKSLELVPLEREKKNSDGKKIQLFLPQLKERYNSVYEHWDELNIDTVKLMDKPLLEADDIEYMDYRELKIKKNLIIVEGKGFDTGLIYDDMQEKTLEFENRGKKYELSSKSNEVFYNYNIHGVCIVVQDNDIFVVKQRDYKKIEADDKGSTFKRKYKTGPIGIPYVLVVDGKRTELGVLQAAQGEFAVPEAIDSWCYMGFPDDMPTMVAEGDVLIRK